MTVALSLALVFNALSLALFVRPVSAAALTLMSAEMTRQDTDEDTSFEITYTNTTVMSTPDTITLTFQSDFDLSGVLFSDVDLNIGGNEQTIVAGAATDPAWGFAQAGLDLTFDSCLGGEGLGCYGIDPTDVVIIQIGATAAGGVNLVDNPTATGSYSIDVADASDSGTMYVPILDDDFVTINADVETHIQFDIDIDDIGATGTGHDTDDSAPYSIELFDLIFTDVTDEDTETVGGQGNDGIIENGGVDEIYFDLTTNSTGGAVIDVYAAADDLTSASTGGSIPSADGVLDVDTALGGWGIACEQQVAPVSGSTMVDTAPYEGYGTPDDVGGVPDGVWANIFTVAAAIQDGDGMCAVRAVAGNQTLAADDYTNTLYFRATATF